MLEKTLQREKRRLIRHIKTTLAPHLRASGYRTGPIGESRALKLWVPRDSEGKATRKTFKLRGALTVAEVEGFTEEGVITDCEGGGLATTYFRGMPIEDLMKVAKFAEKQFASQPATCSGATQ